ncbi:hypothetical protein SAMN05444266_101104 [Chitinophaga jiangningensis]|uniref:Lipoprotein n=1 Tax=Chitinophaga jiangningensis TaxID=1419482 RepID=A0A1M6V8A2_9BACT|nr:hypothetical protein [Chitinophaga jiangningensis]SHK77710.1 hypothetical protein SAMN05444266_101104 [Chitinophaga jiangningensis]
MKKLLVFLLVSIGACKQASQSHCKSSYTIDIWDFNSSMAYSTHYRITNDSLLLCFLDGLEDKKDTVLLSRILSAVQRDSICNYLSQMHLDSFKSTYINPYAEDGDQKELKFRYGNIDKKITVSNVYMKSLGDLYDMLNRVIADRKYRIRFRRENIDFQLDN